MLRVLFRSSSTHTRVCVCVPTAVQQFCSLQCITSISQLQLTSSAAEMAARRCKPPGVCLWSGVCSGGGHLGLG